MAEMPGLALRGLRAKSFNAAGAEEGAGHEIIERFAHDQVASFDDASRLCFSPADMPGLLGPVTPSS
jgi:hypothetical protein